MARSLKWAEYVTETTLKGKKPVSRIKHGRYAIAAKKAAKTTELYRRAASGRYPK